MWGVTEADEKLAVCQVALVLTIDTVLEHGVHLKTLVLDRHNLIHQYRYDFYHRLFVP